MLNAERMPVSLVGLCERSSDVDVRLLTVCRNIFMLTMMLWYKHTEKLSISVDISKWNEIFLRDANEKPLEYLDEQTQGSPTLIVLSPEACYHFLMTFSLRMS